LTASQAETQRASPQPMSDFEAGFARPALMA